MDKVLKEFRRKLYARFWYVKNRDKQISYTKEWTKNNYERAQLNWRNSKRKNAPTRRKQQLRFYGLSIADYESLIQSQSGNCAICHKAANTFKKNLAVDHDHITGKVRGLLCMSCNTAIGKLDTTELLQSAVKYLSVR